MRSEDIEELAAAVPCSLAAIDAAMRVLRDPRRPGEPWPDARIVEILPKIATAASLFGQDLSGAAANVRAAAHAYGDFWPDAEDADGVPEGGAP